MALFEIENLTFRYPDCAPALDGVHFSVRRGEFVVLAGRSGSGKTTLLNCLKKETVPYGDKSGTVRYDGAEIGSMSARQSAQIGYVTQYALPVAANAIDDLKFGVENLGLSDAEMTAALGEAAAVLGITGLLGRPLAGLSGGEKKLVQLGGVLAMRPRVLLLDEPTAQLDPVAAAQCIDVLRRLNENGLTVVMTAHRGEALEFADTLIVLDKGKLVYCGKPAAAPDGGYMPPAARLYAAMNGAGEPPMSVGGFLRRVPPASDVPPAAPANDSRTDDPAPAVPAPIAEEPVVRLKKVRFAFGKNLPDVLETVSADFYAGRHYCLLGALGSGKTTVLGVIGGVRIPYAGKAYVLGKPVGSYRNGELYGVVSAVSQNPRFMFTETTVRKDLDSLGGDVEGVARDLGLTDLLERHPYDLSGGELQLAALAKALLAQPRVLLLDEPSKGLDRAAADVVGRLIRRLTDTGLTVITATHDVDFAADYGDCASFVFDGRITPPAPVDEFFAGNTWFTTDASLIGRELGRPEAGTARLAAVLRGTGV